LGEEKPDEELMGKRKSSPRLSPAPLGAGTNIVTAIRENIRRGKKFFASGAAAPVPHTGGKFPAFRVRNSGGGLPFRFLFVQSVPFARWRGCGNISKNKHVNGGGVQRCGSFRDKPRVAR
jgi:hypothetical protein